jgi:DNA replication protein
MDSSFKGFPPRAEVTPLPNIFFSEVLPLMEDAIEVKVVMQVFFLLSRRKGYPRFVSFSELIHDAVIIKGLCGIQGNLEIILKKALDTSVQTGILMHIPIDVQQLPDDVYFINNQAERETVRKILDGSLKIPQVEIRKVEEPVRAQPSDIYNLYEQNIGMLTPILAEELQEAEHRYPAEWIQDAFREAVRANVRSWKYIHSILKRWEREGKKDGKPVGDSRQERDPDKYIRGQYGHMVRR